MKASLLSLVVLAGCSVGAREVFSEESHGADTPDEFIVQVYQESDDTLELKTTYNEDSITKTFDCDTTIDKEDVKTTWNPDTADPNYTSVQVVIAKDGTTYVDELIEFGNW